MTSLLESKLPWLSSSPTDLSFEKATLPGGFFVSDNETLGMKYQGIDAALHLYSPIISSKKASMKLRYLYGKAKYLNPVINGEEGIRFSDLSHYSRLENEKMRDDEMKKKFIIKKDSDFILKINDFIINNSNLSDDVVFTVEPRHCYCLCLTTKKDSTELYRDFEADTCIAFDVDLLEERLKIASGKFPGSFIRGQDITYYDQYTMHAIRNSHEEMVFYKPTFFSHESEYRIAWFYPLDKIGFRGPGENIPFRFKDKSSHLTFFHLVNTFITDCIVEVYRAHQFDT